MNNREIERKFTVEGLTYDEAIEVLKSVSTCTIDATSYDLYWAAGNVDFVRLRENSRELTVKVTDKETIVDRIEENIKIERGAMQDCNRAMTLLYGPPMKLVKEFSVFKDAGTITCLYKVEGDPKNRVFLEVEGDDLYDVDREVTYLISKKHLTLTPVPYSLYQLFKEGL